ncbi:hypothetical protein GW17_00002325 [Ensete ventricosum]|nr:hypothetical protein GW17_00002325 [Ensete ventricosum]
MFFTWSSFVVGLFWACIQPMTISMCWANTAIWVVRSAKAVGLSATMPSVFLSPDDRGMNSDSCSSSPDFSYLCLVITIHKNVALIHPDPYEMDMVPACREITSPLAYAKGDEDVGIRVRVRVQKSKVCKTWLPYKQAEFEIIFGEGGCLLDCAELMDIVVKRGSWYSYGENRLATHIYMSMGSSNQIWHSTNSA